MRYKPVSMVLKKMYLSGYTYDSTLHRCMYHFRACFIANKKSLTSPYIILRASIITINKTSLN